LPAGNFLGLGFLVLVFESFTGEEDALNSRDVRTDYKDIKGRDKQKGNN
jgi:hypothetical protein